MLVWANMTTISNSSRNAISSRSRLSCREREWRGYRVPSDALVLLDLPQGGGDHAAGHRCASEWPAIEVLKVTLGFSSMRLDYDVPARNLLQPKAHHSTPNSGFVIMGESWGT